MQGLRLDGLGESEARAILAALAAAQDIIVLTASDGSIVFVNRDLPSLSRERLVGTRLHDHVEAADRARLQEAIHTALESGEHVGTSVSLVSPAGPTPVSIRILPIREPGIGPRLVLFVQAASAHRRAGEGKDTSVTMQDIGRKAVHDFNNVLTAVRYHAAFAIEDLPAESPVLRELRDIDEAAQRGMEIAARVLDEISSASDASASRNGT